MIRKQETGYFYKTCVWVTQKVKVEIHSIGSVRFFPYENSHTFKFMLKVCAKH